MNGKLYIGQTCQNEVENRYKNGLNYQKCRYFWNAIKKYGWHNFEHITLFDNLTKELADIIEIELIRKYNSANNLYGYNLQLGGNGGTPNEETKMTMRSNHADVNGCNNPMFNKKHSNESKQKMSDNRPSYKGKNNPNYGKKCSDLTKNKIKLKNSKSILQIDTNGNFIKRWESISEASEKLYISIGNISRVCTELRGTAGGFKWKFENESRNENDILFIDGRKNRSKPIVQKAKNGTIIAKYGCIKEAQQLTNITSISNCLSGRYKTAGGYVWEYNEVV